MPGCATTPCTVTEDPVSVQVPDELWPIAVTVQPSGNNYIVAIEVCRKGNDEFSEGVSSLGVAHGLLVTGIPVSLELPYRFKTKGELITECANQRIVPKGVSATMSCSHPAANRFFQLSASMHCGYCLPCIVRRAAISAASIPDPTTYAFNDLSQPLTPERQKDLRVLRMALDRYGRKAPRLADVLVPGPLPVSSTDLSEYLGVFRRGLDEIRTFLSRFN